MFSSDAIVISPYFNQFFQIDEIEATPGQAIHPSQLPGQLMYREFILSLGIASETMKTQKFLYMPHKSLLTMGSEGVDLF